MQAGGLDEASRRPGQGRQLERWRWQHLSAAFAQLSLSLSVETSRVPTGGTDAEKERLPPLLQGRVLDADGQSAFLDLVQTGCVEEPAEMTLARHASHLAKSCDGVRHEVNDQLCQGGVERSISERQLLRRGALHADPRVALSSCCNERL
jgi:hypothetical protein